MFVGLPATLNAVDTSAGWHEKGQRLVIQGTVYQRDGKTLAPGVLLYYWQTDNNGYYSPKPGLDERAKQHGHLRGWVKTDSRGHYAIYTIRPAPYPARNTPAHLHFSVKEPGIRNEYYLDDIVFDDDPLLTQETRKSMENRGGNGVVKPTLSKGILLAQRNIVLGLNIPHYPPQTGSEK
ncbi:hypothetical protein GCM10011405_25120 [Rufibacter glacialis]|nr:hypothetical protein GCM10011405_25120 [Rufibacter glacialis]